MNLYGKTRLGRPVPDFDGLFGVFAEQLSIDDALDRFTPRMAARIWFIGTLCLEYPESVPAVHVGEGERFSRDAIESFLGDIANGNEPIPFSDGETHALRWLFEVVLAVEQSDSHPWHLFVEDGVGTVPEYAPDRSAESSRERLTLILEALIGEGESE